MARIKPSVIISDIRGKVGGSTFQKSQGGLVVKSNSKKVNKNSIPQNHVRNLTAVMQSKWLAIGQTNRDIWKRFASFANVQQKGNVQAFLNAQQLFIKTNVIRSLYGYSILNPPQFSKCITLSVSFSVDIVTGSLILTASRLIDADVEFVVCFASVPVRQTVNNPGSRLKALIFTTTTGTEFDITTAYTNKIGRAPVSGETIFVRAFVANKETGLFTPANIIKQTLS